MTFSSLPPRTKRMKRTPFQRKPGASQGGFSSGAEHSPVTKRKTRRAETGFTCAQRIAIRTRAGKGDPDDAECEACGIPLGRHGGQVQHIVARGKGGSRYRSLSIRNGALLCGTSETGCHGACEDRDPHYRAMGFWRKTTDPPSPIMLHGVQGGMTVWLTDDGSYSLEAPAGAL